jgi:Uncharacterized protein conserved in bacteria (DUF2334)
MTVSDWLPAGKRAAVCLTVDDVHPAPVAEEALGHVRWLQERHPLLRATLFTTPDWRSRAPFPTAKIVRHVPLLRDAVFTVPVDPPGTYRLDRHERFCSMLREWGRVEIGLHGLHHVRRGMRPIVEFAGRSVAACSRRLTAALAIFEEARLPIVRGMSPPGWEAPPPLVRAMAGLGLTFVASARDLDTPVRPGAVTGGSGLRSVSLLRPERLAGGVVHFTTNFQATSTLERAFAILDAGGLLAIKAHLLAGVGSYRALDGLSLEYREHLDRVLAAISERYRDTLWWTSMGEIASR